MASIQHILVSAEDSVLAKKVRFLLANDQCEVEILEPDANLDERLALQKVDLLVLSRDVRGEDAIELLGRINPSLLIPPTLVLGGPTAVTADFIHLIPDPIDTQAIYKIASDILSRAAVQATAEDATLMSLEQPDFSGHGQPESDNNDKVALPKSGTEEKLSYSDVTGLDEIAGRLDQLESDQLNEQLSGNFDIDDAGAPPPARRPVAKKESPVKGGPLDPAKLATVLYQCWSKAVTGVLTVTRDSETSSIYMDKGSVVHIESSIPGDALGKALVTRGRITDAQYADGAKRSIERGVGLGQALVDLGFFTIDELGTELGNTARDSIVGCFAARSGTVEFMNGRSSPKRDRPYQLESAHVIAQGLRTHADDAVLNDIMGDAGERYFKLRKPISELAGIFPLSTQDEEFLAFSGRAYNITDSAESSGLKMQDAYKLLSLLTICQELSDFTPGLKEFEGRIKEEQQRVKTLQSTLPQTASTLPSTPAPVPTPSEPESALPAFGGPGPFGAASEPFAAPDAEQTLAGEQPPAPVPSPSGGSPFNWGEPAQEAPPPPAAPPPPPFGTNPAAAAPEAPPPMPPPPAATAPVPAPIAPPAPAEDIPPMPVPADGSAGLAPRPLVFAKPLPRGQDGQVIETSERTLSREHFQRGVTLLGQGNFANAEEAFRDAVALCSEEHVYLIGLARAIYYNPGYGAAGKVPILSGIVQRASQLAPGDKRVETLGSWIAAAAAQV